MKQLRKISGRDTEADVVDRIATVEHRIEAKLEAKVEDLSSQLNGFQECVIMLFRQCNGSQERMITMMQDLQTSQQQLQESQVLKGSISARAPGSARNVSKDIQSVPRAVRPCAARLSPGRRSPGREGGKSTELVPLLAVEHDDPKSKPRLQREPTMTFQEKLAAAQEALQAGKAQQSPAVKAVTAFLEDPESSAAAMYYSYFMIMFNIAAILVGLLPYVGVKLPIAYAEEVDIAIDSFLLLEIVVRGMFCPSTKEFLFNITNIIDCLSALPLLTISLMDLKTFGKDFNVWGKGILLAAVPVIRALRLVRRFPKMQILMSAFRNCLEALPVFLYTMALMAIMFTSMLFFVEPRDNLESLPEAVWLVLSTMTTVGYGDVVPRTPLGHALTSLLMIASPMFMAMPFGIIGHSFTHIWGNRSQILLLQATRDRLAKWGFGAYEIPGLFQLFDLDDSAELDITEFLILLKEMEIGFREDDVVELFKVIDKDNGGTIDAREFIKTLYPSEYRYMFSKKKVADVNVEDMATSPSK